MTKKTVLIFLFFLFVPQPKRALAGNASKDVFTNRVCVLVDASALADPKSPAGSKTINKKIAENALKNIKALVKSISEEYARNTPLEFQLVEAYSTVLDTVDPRYELREFRESCHADGIIIVLTNRQRELKNRRNNAFLKWNDGSEAWGEIFLYGVNLSEPNRQEITSTLLRGIARLYGASETEIPDVGVNFWTDKMKEIIAQNKFRNWAKTPLY